MKNILFILFITLAFTSCSMGDNALDKKIDGSSQESFKKSLASIKKDLSQKDQKDFKDAIKPIIIKAVFSSGLNNKDPDVAQKAILKALGGKTPRELIASNKSTKTVTKKEIKTEDEKETRIEDEKEKEIKLGESIVFSDIEITIQEVSRGKLKGIKDSILAVPKGDFLLIKVQLKNISEGKIRTIQNTWRSTKLQDNFENYYKARSTVISSLVDVVSSERIKPGETLTDTMIFDTPLENAKEFIVISEPHIYKSTGDGSLKHLSTGKFEFKFTKSDIK